MARAMTETERAQRHEAIIRDSFRAQQRNIDDWVQMLTVLGESKEEVVKMLDTLAQFVDHTRAAIALGFRR